MRIDQRLLGPGVFLILVGAVPLAVREGAIPLDDLAGIWRLWPLFLVAAGLGLLLRGTALRELGGVLAAGLGGVFVGALLAGAASDGLGSIACSGDRDDGRPFTGASGTLQAPGTAALTLDCGEATLRAGEGDTWRLSGRSADGVAPTVDAAASRLVVRSPRGTGIPAASARWSDLDLTVPGTTEAYELTLQAGSLTATAGTGLRRIEGTVNAGSLVADLGPATGLATIDLTVNAGSASITLPDASVRGSLTVNAGAIELCTPADVGLRLTTRRGGLAGNDFGSRGLVEADGVWTTPGWESATHVIELDTTANAGGFSLNPEDGCR